MDLWHAGALGHRSVPSLWGRARDEKCPGGILGDVREMPASIQVYNAVLYDRLSACSADCGLGLSHLRRGVEDKENVQRATRFSLRAYANERLEHQRRVHERIRDATDTDKLVWEAQVRTEPRILSRQMAHATREYTLAAVILRRASELGSAYASASLAKLFGFGIVRSGGRFLFERDSLRGVAWGTRALQLISAQETDDGAAWSLAEQVAAMLCAFVCSPEACDALLSDNGACAVATRALLVFPRRCEVWRPREHRGAGTQAAMDDEPLWESLDAARAALQQRLPAVSGRFGIDAEATDHGLQHAAWNLRFLEAFSTMHAAFRTKSSSLVESTYALWSEYLQDCRDGVDALLLARLRRVASEGQQWSAPDAERKIRPGFNKIAASAGTAGSTGDGRETAHIDSILPAVLCAYVPGSSNLDFSSVFSFAGCAVAAALRFEVRFVGAAGGVGLCMVPTGATGSPFDEPALGCGAASSIDWVP
ncbi:hypothetical protein MSPP1_002034 [Malassezia sp. CBS 17886]|nr:hypothetical protein MSPP1_002034 [Malassezia sp. CBS 17886]